MSKSKYSIPPNHLNTPYVNYFFETNISLNLLNLNNKKSKEADEEHTFNISLYCTTSSIELKQLILTPFK